MPIIILIAVLSALRYFEVWRFAQLSWWWVIGLAALAFAWFEFIEPLFGLDKRKAHDEDEKRRQARVKASFNKKK
ncbi:MAG: TIGR04438 family Trp-rich protein [Burkholderiaceae bacterium]|nr:TIGR04438 family Trp-rich protein [Burkholderiaceae bacterium]